MRKNRLRELLNVGRPSLGTHIQIPYPGIVELIGHSGVFDYVEIVLEYMPWDLQLLEHFGRAVEIFPDLSAMAKIEQGLRVSLASRAIGAGLQNVLFSDPRTVEDVRECVRAVRPETPEDGGVHGVSVNRSVGYFTEAGSAALVKSLQDTVVAIMIEKKTAVENLEELLSIKGVDMVQFGPADYAMSIGLAGQWNHPDVRKAEQLVIDTALNMGIAPRAEINNPEAARKYIDMGVKHFCIGWDIRVLQDWHKKAGDEMRKIIGG